MSHDFYKYINDERSDDLVEIFNGDSPRLTRVNVRTSINFNLSGDINRQDIIMNQPLDSLNEENNDKLNSIANDELKENPPWKSNLKFNYSADWGDIDKSWDYRFELFSTHQIQLSSKWRLTYVANFNIIQREMTFHSIKILRPLHCWEFSFNYYPRGISSGFSLRINVKNPDLQDIKITSKDKNRGFIGY